MDNKTETVTADDLASLPQQLREQSTYLFPKAADTLMSKAAAEIELLRTERDLYKWQAEMNMETIKAMCQNNRSPS